ncbi:hypothetical protein ANN_25229 [Periplaneta americana]|uniref:ORC6 second cyclin-like domain-containing protein n=1 Tax=Periplaneta americana TaxID=6978 RepID=A0ABQ8S1A6_PERAM|nr:hypothetical protein ANN_25229 [Periplaneta americana]
MQTSVSVNCLKTDLDLTSDTNKAPLMRCLRWAEHVARMGESRNAYRVLVGRPEGKRPLGRPRLRWEDNIKMDLREVGYDDREWINLAQDRDQWWAYVRAAMNLWVPEKPFVCEDARSLSVDLCHPMYSVAAVIAACKHCKLKVDRAELVEMGQIRKSSLLKLVRTFEKYAQDVNPSPKLKSLNGEEDEEEFKAENIIKKISGVFYFGVTNTVKLVQGGN